MMIIKSKINDAAEIEGKHYNISRDFAEALDEKVKHLIKDACRRARDNNRSTVMPRDL